MLKEYCVRNVCELKSGKDLFSVMIVVCEKRIEDNDSEEDIFDEMEDEEFIF